MLIDKPTLISYIKDELDAGIVNLELSDTIIERNLDRALFISSDYFNYTSYKTVEVNKTTGSSGYVSLDQLDDEGQVPTIVKVYPTTNIMNIDAALLGLGSIYINMGMSLTPQLVAYSNMITRLANMESILGRNARVVGNKLYVDHYWSSITIEYIPNTVKVENIHEGAWIKFLVDYTSALCKRQLAQSRGKYIVASNPFTANADQLLSQANEEISRLEEDIKSKGIILVTK